MESIFISYKFAKYIYFWLISDHNWFVAKLKIFKISMVDWFGGAKIIPVKDYLAYNYTGTEIYNYYYKTGRHVSVDDLETVDDQSAVNNNMLS